MDEVKNAFAARMVSSSKLHFTNSAKEPTSAEIQINEACGLYSLMNTFQEKGWAIPKQVSFWYFCIFLHLFRLLCNKHLKTVKPERTN